MHAVAGYTDASTGASSSGEGQKSSIINPVAVANDAKQTNAASAADTLTQPWTLKRQVLFLTPTHTSVPTKPLRGGERHDECDNDNDLGSEIYIHEHHDTSAHARRDKGSDDTRHFDTPHPLSPPRLRQRKDDEGFPFTPSINPTVNWELSDRHIRMAKKKKGKAAPTWTPPKEDPPEEDKTPEENGGGDDAGGGDAGSGDGGDGDKKDDGKKEKEVPPEDDDWGSFAPVGKKGKKKGKKEPEPEPEPEKAEDKFNAFAEIKLDDGGALDLNFGSTADNNTDSGGGTSFGAWGSSWATAGKKEEIKPVASAWGVPAKTASAWGAKTSFSFGGLNDEAEKTKEPESEPKEDDFVGFVNAKDKKKKKKGAAEVIPDPVPDPLKEEEQVEDDWSSGWGAASTNKKKEEPKPIASSWGSAWGNSAKKADPEPVKDGTLGSFGKRTSKALVEVVPEEPSPPPPPAAPEVGDLDDDDGFSAWATAKPKKKKNGADDGPLKPDVVEEPKDDIWGAAASKKDKKKGKSAFDALEEVTDEPLIDLDGDKKKAEETSGGWGSIWGSKDKKKGLDVPPTAPTPPNMDLTEAEEDIWGNGGDSQEPAGPSPEQIRVDELEIDLAVEKGKPKKKSKTQQKKQDDAIKKIEKELDEAKEALKVSKKSSGPSKEEEEARLAKEADDEIARLEAELAEQDALDAKQREEEEAEAEQRRLEEQEAAKKKADEEAAAAAEVSVFS